MPFIEQGVPAIDLIDFDFPCFHQRCDDLSAVSERSLNVTGETVLELLREPVDGLYVRPGGLGA